MKKIFAIAIVILVIQKWEVISDFVSPPPNYSFVNNSKVVLYTTSWCGYCAKTRRFLSKNGISYEEYDVEKSDEGRDQYNALGAGGVPILLINSEIVRGYDPNRILKLLKKI